MSNKGIFAPPLGTPLNRNHPLSRGIVGAWLLNEGGGLKAFDSSYNHNHGTLTNGVFGKKQLGSCFLGVNLSSTGVVMGTTTNLDIPGDITLSAWIQPNNINAGTRQIVCNSNAGGSLIQWNLEVNRTAGKVTMLYNKIGVAVTSASSLVAQVWQHIVGTRKGATGAWTYSVYINGRLDATATTANNPDAHQIDSIGCGGNVNFQWFGGNINNVIIYNRCLTQEEVKQLYIQPYCMYVNKK